MYVAGVQYVHPDLHMWEGWRGCGRVALLTSLPGSGKAFFSSLSAVSNKPHHLARLINGNSMYPKGELYLQCQWPLVRADGEHICQHYQLLSISPCRLCGPNSSLKHTSHIFWDRIAFCLKPCYVCSHVQLGHLWHLPTREGQCRRGSCCVIVQIPRGGKAYVRMNCLECVALHR